MERLLLDTNVLVRFLLGEPAKQAEAAARVFNQCDEGAFELELLPIVAAETVFVLYSFYEQERAEIARVLTHVIASRGVICNERDVMLRALRQFAGSNVHFVDCYLAAASEVMRQPIASSDHDFDKLPGVTRIDPDSLP